MPERPAVLVIAGSDSSGGAGLQRDLAVIRDFDVDAVCAVTAVTAQSDARVHRVHHVPPETVRAQIAAALESRAVAAVKIGMLGSAPTVAAVAEALGRLADAPIVLDPVLASSSGGTLLDRAGRKALGELLLPSVSLLTPNIPEAAVLTGLPEARDERGMAEQARRILALGPQAVLLKGGHRASAEAVDMLVEAEGRVMPAARDFDSPVVMARLDRATQYTPDLRQDTGSPGLADRSPEDDNERSEASNVGATSITRFAGARWPHPMRGTGCALSSAIAALLAMGTPLPEACRRAKHYLARLARRRSAGASGAEAGLRHAADAEVADGKQ